MKKHYNKFIVLGLGILVFIVSISFKVNSDQKVRLLEIAKEYKTYSVYANSSWKWTIPYCAPTAAINEHIDSLHFISKADSKISPHGNKLYKFFVKNISSYKDTTIKNQPFGQVLVKETWNVKEVSWESVFKNKLVAKRSENDGKWYIPTTVSELFIMYKEKENNTNDKGWVYGIVNLENSSVKILENGKISSCISCHKGTKYDRIFGME